MNVSERRFVWLLKQRGYHYWFEDHLEEVIAVKRKRPDFYVQTLTHGFLAEVEAFREPLATMSIRENQKRINGAVREAAKQLKPYQDLKVPLLVVLDNWRQTGVSLGNVDLMQVFGVFGLRADVAADEGRLTNVRFEHGGQRQLSADHNRYISAVLVNYPEFHYDEDDFSLERPMKVRLIHNPFAEVEFPKDIFSYAGDLQIVYDRLVGWRQL